MVSEFYNDAHTSVAIQRDILGTERILLSTKVCFSLISFLLFNQVCETMRREGVIIQVTHGRSKLREP